MTVKAPSVTSLRISKLSANQVQVRWDDVGANFYYFVEIAETKNASGTNIPEAQLRWLNLGYTAESSFFYNTTDPLTSYKIRVGTAAQEFEQSDWVYTEAFETFATNAYTFQHMIEMQLANKFIQEKFTLNNQDYVNFNNDTIMAALMNESFQFSSSYVDVSSISNFIIGENEYHEIQGTIEQVCKDINRVYLMESDDVLYLFERYQPIVKVSNDKGQTWQAVKLFNDRVGYPLSKTVYYQSDNTTYVLGYDKIFYGRKSTDVRWSADDVRFSSQDITFAKLGDQLHLGFDVEIFSNYASLPANVSRITEAITCNDDYVYVAARDKVRFIKTSNAPIDSNPLSPTYSERLFETETFTITGNPKAVCYKLDSIGDKIFALITGEVETLNADPRTNPILDSADKGIYVLDHDTGKFRRVFGNTAEERRRIEPGYASMSTDGTLLSLSSSNFKFLESDIVPDPKTAEKYKLLDAVKYEFPREFLADKHYHMMAFISDETSGWESFSPQPMKYYAEPFFSWSRKSNTRCWINNSNRVVVVYADLKYTKVIDNFPETSPNRVVHETWNEGDMTVVMPNVKFTGFKKYASGMLFYKSSGEIISYYDFNYRVKDNVEIIWKPTEVFLQAFLQNQEHEIPWTPEEERGLADPDLRPLINVMMPDAYLLQDSNFETFCEAYIQYLSDGNGTQYNNLLNLVKNQYPREDHAWEYLWSEVYKRNIYLNADKRDLVSRFFEARSYDFYSTKGIEASYKFLFKVLYNEEVEIEIESGAGTEYDIVIQSDSITEDLVGQTIYTATGRCNVTYVERSYQAGKLQWTVTIHNLLGRLIAGQEVKAERLPGFDGDIIRGVKGKDLLHNNIDYINRSRSYYVMKIKSNLPSSRWKSDVIRFVHPVGFGFIAITLLTMFINAGLTLKHTETIINKYKNYKWDSGLPTEYADRVAKLTVSDEIEHDPITGEAIYEPGPMAGIVYPLPANYNSENNNSIFQNQLPSARRKLMSPLFDASGTTFAQFRDLVNERLKDNIGNPRDPENPTQVKIDE